MEGPITSTPAPPSSRCPTCLPTASRHWVSSSPTGSPCDLSILPIAPSSLTAQHFPLPTMLPRWPNASGSSAVPTDPTTPTATNATSSSSPGCIACRCATSSTGTSTPPSTSSALHWPSSLPCAGFHGLRPRSPATSATSASSVCSASRPCMQGSLPPEHWPSTR